MTDFAATRAFFDLPDGVVYLDGNSLGPTPKGAAVRAERVIRAEWGERLIRGWNECGWMDAPAAVGDRIARLIGAPPGTVVVGDTLTIRLHQALSAALERRPGRRVVLSDDGNFPSDLYAAEGLLRSLGRGHALKVVAPERVAEAIDADVAVLMLTHVDYRTGRLHDMAALTARAREAGVATVWDLAHSAGALVIDLADAGADYAVGCTYKYLNGGPGAPAFLYAARGRTEAPALRGWLGHADPFAFERGWRAADGVARFRVGTPPVIQTAILDEALDVFDLATMDDLRAASIALSERFVAEVERRCPRLELASPRNPAMRGSQVSFRFADGYAAMRALISRGVIGDFRAPDLMRFGFAPLYTSERDVVRAAETLEAVLVEGLHERPEHRVRAAVT